MKIKTSRFKATVNGYGLTTDRTDHGRSVSGLVTTPGGFVRAFSGDFTNSNGLHWRFSCLTAIRDGVEYYRRFEGKAYSARGLVTKARQFVEEIERGEG